jgi:hypothetical protein
MVGHRLLLSDLRVLALLPAGVDAKRAGDGAEHAVKRGELAFRGMVVELQKPEPRFVQQIVRVAFELAHRRGEHPLAHRRAGEREGAGGARRSDLDAARIHAEAGDLRLQTRQQLGPVLRRLDAQVLHRELLRQPFGGEFRRPA